MTLRFEWDEPKNKTNREKHGIWFEEVTPVFDDPHGRLFLDEGPHEARSEAADEERYLLVGMSRHLHVLVVVHCYKCDDSLVRIISARKATRSERKYYEETI